MTTLFVADLHLSYQRPEKISLFKKLLERTKKADALYILGDLFDDFWIGCDDPQNLKIISSLYAYSQAGQNPLFIMRGNRDFHLNQDFAIATGSQLIDDPYEITLDNKKVMLMHGDTLCTDDVKYQMWRRFITNPIIKWLYSIMPLALRKQIAHNVRATTTEMTRNKIPEIMDVAAHTVIKKMNQYNIETLIHGHTHRQAIHKMNLNGKPVMRIVLGDWYQQDCILIHDKTGFRFERVEDYLKNN